MTTWVWAADGFSRRYHAHDRGEFTSCGLLTGRPRTKGFEGRLFSIETVNRKRKEAMPCPNCYPEVAS